MNTSANAYAHSRETAANDRERKTWSSMIQRCTNQRLPCYPHYGGRGITVCDRWRGKGGFENFLADMGPRPMGMSLDRINNDGNYEPGNCRWATQRQQMSNMRRNRHIEIGGVTKTIAEWAAESVVSYHTFQYRIIRGWDPALALVTPNVKGQKRFRSRAA